MILQSSINTQGSIFIAGYTATNKLYGFLQCFAMSVGQASCTFVSQNYGAGLGQRVRQGVSDSVKIVMGMAIVIIAVTLMTGRQLLSVFLDVSNPEGIHALDVSVRYLTIMVLSFPILHILHVFRNVLQALGVAVWSLMSGFAELTARILMSKFVIGYLGADALFLSEPASWLGAMLCVFLPYFYYRKKLLR
jgi:Na+-driven multidrug efflux pump